MNILMIVSMCIGAGQPGVICPYQLADGRVHLVAQWRDGNEQECANRAKLVSTMAYREGWGNQLFACVRDDGSIVWAPSGWRL